MTKNPQVVIVGGGFGGLAAARALKRAPVDITLIDRKNHHLFQPLLYQVATAALSPGDIAHPIRSILAGQKNVRVLLAEAGRIDTERQTVEIDNGELSYDYLVVAAGVTHSYYGQDQWAAYAPGLKTVEDALDIRRRVLLAYEAAEREADPEAKRAWLTFVVVGGGPTGVEMAGALAEIGRHTLAADFRDIDPTEARVVLLEGADRVLPTFPAKLSTRAHKQLEHLGVEVCPGKRVGDVDADGVFVDGERLAARTVMWAAGIRGASVGESLGVATDRTGRVLVEPDLSIPGHPEVFVVGDLASIRADGAEVPGLAPAAMQGGACAGKNIQNTLAGRDRKPFRYLDKGTLATVGRSRAVGHFRGRFQFSGFLAWVLWWAIHVFFLIGFRNRFVVMFGWIWNYVTFQRGARLITGDLPALPTAVDRKPDKLAAP